MSPRIDGASLRSNAVNGRCCAATAASVLLQCGLVVLLGPDAPPPWFALLNSHPGLMVRNTARSYTVPHVAQMLIYAGVCAQRFNGRLAVADISGPEPGPFPPHKSHQNGFDADVSYDLRGVYPTPTSFSITPTWVAVVNALAPWLEVVFMSESRIGQWSAALASSPWPQPAKPVTVTEWPGHATHGHLRFRNPFVQTSFATPLVGC